MRKGLKQPPQHIHILYYQFLCKAVPLDKHEHTTDLRLLNWWLEDLKTKCFVSIIDMKKNVVAQHMLAMDHAHARHRHTMNGFKL